MRNKTKVRYIRLQSAMEYLMTYGWAILIIAVVLGALFQLGVFNSANFAPRAPPGSCRVFRAAGTINLEGVCSGELPQYVTQLLSSAGGSLNVQDAASFHNLQELSFSLWIYVSALGGSNNWPTIISKGNENSDGWRVYQDTVNPTITFAYHSSNGNGYWIMSESVPLNKWYFVTVTYSLSSGIASMYANGVYVSSSNTVNPINANSDPLVISDSRLNGMVADVQIYNTSLSANDVRTLYIRGIGGAPPFLRNLVGWWPLNGDVNDYSGNSNNGAPSGVSYVSSWINSYAPP